MTALPAASDFTGSTRTEAQVKAALTDLRGFLADLFGTDGAAATALATMGALAAQTVDVTASTAVTAADRGRILRVTAAATLTLPALSAVPAGWTVIIRCSAGGTATVTAAGSDLISGVASFTLRPTTWSVISATASQWVTWGAGGAVDVAQGSAAAPGLFFNGDPDSGMFWIGADQIGWAAGGVLRMALSTTALTPAVPVRAPAGSAAAPAFGFSGDTDSGMFWIGADQIGWATGGVLRLSLSTTALTSTLPVLFPLGSAAAPGMAFTGDTNTGWMSPGADIIAGVTNGVERIRVSNAGLRVGDTTPTGAFGLLQVSGDATGGLATFSVTGNAASASSPLMIFNKTRATVAGGVDIVQTGDTLGIIRFNGADGTDVNNTGADIVSTVTGTPAADDIRSNFRVRTRGSGGLADRLVVDDVSAAITGRLVVNGTHAWATLVTIADDAVATVTPGRTGGFLMLTASGGVGAAATSEQFSAPIFFDCGSTAPAISKGTGFASLGANVAVVTTDVTGTSGTDGNVTVSARNNGTLKIENRSGASVAFNIWVM